LSDIEDDARAAAREWLLAVKKQTGWTWTQIAKASGVSQSTLVKAIDTNRPFVLSTKTIAKISAATGIAPPERLAGMPVSRAPGLAETEAVPYDAAGALPELKSLVDGYIRGRPNLVAWELKTRALELAGYLPGDIVVIDMNERAQRKDIVCAQVYNYDRGTAATIWRRYEQPYLVAASADPELARPERDDSAKIMGVVLMSFRPRRAA
jgi:hypothetical protein